MSQQTQIIVKSVTAVREGRTRNGGTYTLWQVIATKVDGTPIDQNIRSFEDLPLNVPIDVKVEPFEGSFGTSYTVTLADKKQGLGARVIELEDRISRLESIISAQVQAGPPPPPPAP